MPQRASLEELSKVLKQLLDQLQLVKNAA